ncbi:hypothetical protein J5N97_021358 [Dioscorea zingiberensis]|uniref:Kinesin motor domain-containing protein n=1 Tax=Dioscorea zingiberensis TaxID=325984 RepID=A0A9D5HE99_9LILI|nr:hypothetical protein J5N97_021358 [Dioscorea zingiberensis]
MASRQEKEKAVNVQVLLRCRPFNEEEKRSNAPQVVTCNEYQREVSVSQTIASKQFDRVFTFDKVFGPLAQQRDVYEQAVVPIVNEVLEGFNCTIFAYGQTGTGKTYTMEGDCKRAKCGSKGQLPSDAGVIPRAVKQIFDTLESQSAEYSVKVTFLELYNEEITDLLAPEELAKAVLEDKQRKPLTLMEDGKGGVLVRGLEEEIVTNAGEIFSLLERGCAKRRTAETLLNKQSSRSHSLFSITIHIKEATPEGEELIKSGKLNLVDLAGSENITRSGAREGRAREAGEINKSLLTLGRVITALVEHLGHIPYRDSKLTRLLRDSLGGRTKTCIIATVSPSVHCLEETLSTLDYAHRAKNIKNRPEVNQKMMKSTLIKDLYGEIDRLKAEVYAAREKVGVYIPKERYYQEENERKAMSDQIAQMGILLENNQRQLEDLQQKYNTQLQQSADLSQQLAAAEKNLEHTVKLLTTTEEDLKHSQYALKEKDFIISEQRKAETALTHQACVLQAELEKSIRDNGSLFSKIAREDQLNVANRSTVNNFQAELEGKINTLCHTVSSSIVQQRKHLQCVEELCQSSLDFNEKAMSELEKKLSGSKALYMSYMEAVQNVVRLHEASANAALEEMTSLTSTNSCTLDHLLALGEKEADQIIGDLQNMLSSHRAEIAHFTQELRERCIHSLNHTREMSKFITGFLDKLGEENWSLHIHSSKVHGVHEESIVDFQKVYEEQSRLEADELLGNISSLLSKHIQKQKELVDMRLVGLKHAALENKTFLDGHTSSIEGAVHYAKRKWETFSAEAMNGSKEGGDFSSAKHCQMEVRLQECDLTIDSAAKHWKKMRGSINETSVKHVTEMEALVRSISENNEQNDAEVTSARYAAEKDAAKNSDDVLHYFDAILKHDQEAATETMATINTHSQTLQQFEKDHTILATEIKHHTENTFKHNYKAIQSYTHPHFPSDYEPTGQTPTRSEPVIPSKGTIESLRTMPLETLMQEFRENHPYETSMKPKPSLIPRSPLGQLN